MKKNNGFTLAEVLITLGIIGVVAAVTIPQLVANYQKKTWVEGLKVGISMLEQGFKKAMADDGVDDIRNTTLWQNCRGEDSPSSVWRDNCQPELSKYFKGIKFESVPDMKALGDKQNIAPNTETCKKLVGKTNKWYYLNDKSKCRGWKNVAVTFANGMRADMIVGNVYDEEEVHAGDITALDVNGGKGPNTWGRDTFYLRILPDGRVVGLESRAHAEAYAKFYSKDFETVYDKFKQDSEKCNRNAQEDGTNGIFCAARIIDEGWVMNY